MTKANDESTNSGGQAEIELVPAADITMSAKEAAQFILAYAKKHRILNTNANDDEVDEDDYRATDFATSRKRFESQGVLDALRNREINFIGFDEGRKRVLVFTKRKVTRQIQKILPSSIERQINIEYIEGGQAFVRGSPQESFRPTPYSFVNDTYYSCGSSIYPANCIGAGTLGLLVRDADGNLCGLTNNHVTGVCNNAEPGLPIMAPGPVDIRADGCIPFAIGRHFRLLPIHDGHPENIPIEENLDAACFKILNPALVSSMQGSFYDTPSTSVVLDVGMRVEKVGRTTGRTTGEVIAAAAGPTVVGYEVREYGVRKNVFFKEDHVFVVKNRDGGLFSARGDSGALVVSIDDAGTKHAAGLVFAGDEKNNLSFIMPIDKILKQLNLSLVHGHNV